MKCLKPKDLGCVIVDTTVQENDITFPTDLKLYAKGIELLVREAKRAGVKLKRTYARTVPVLRRASWQFSRRRKYRKAAAYCDKGYRGKAKHKEIPCAIHIPGMKEAVTVSLKKNLKRRNAIEPIIGHLKRDYGMDRNFLKGRIGDEINALMASFAHNRKKTLNRLRIFVQIYLKAENPTFWGFNAGFLSWCLKF